MKAIIRRLRLLENRVDSHEIGGPSWAEVLRERRRRRFEASGLPYEERAHGLLLGEHGRPQSWAEVLRGARARRSSRKGGEVLALPEAESPTSGVGLASRMAR